VGHSYAGLICGAVADMLPEAVSRLILVDGVLPVPGKSFADMSGEPFAKMLQTRATAEGLVQPWPLDSFGVPPETAKWFAERLGPFPRAAFTEPYPDNLAAGPAKRAYISCIPAKNPMLRAMATRAGAEGWEVHALMSGHCAMIATPVELAGQLHNIVRGDPQGEAAESADMPRLDRQLLEDMRRQMHWTCKRLAQRPDEPARPCGD
jgi:pimeloyl-ACP methyl ester carboxylesterase